MSIFPLIRSFPVRTRAVCQPARLFTSSSSEPGPDASENSSSKEIGNPISMSSIPSINEFYLAWANPNNGPSQDDRSSNGWKWAFPVGIGMIAFGMYIVSPSYSHLFQRVLFPDTATRARRRMRNTWPTVRSNLTGQLECIARWSGWTLLLGHPNSRRRSVRITSPNSEV